MSCGNGFLRRTAAETHPADEQRGRAPKPFPRCCAPRLDLRLDVVNAVARLDVKRDRFPGERLHEDLKTTAKRRHGHTTRTRAHHPQKSTTRTHSHDGARNRMLHSPKRRPLKRALAWDNAHHDQTLAQHTLPNQPSHLHAAAQAQHQVQRALLLDVVVSAAFRCPRQDSGGVYKPLTGLRSEPERLPPPAGVSPCTLESPARGPLSVRPSSSCLPAKIRRC